MKNLCAVIKIINMGAVAIITAAIIEFHWIVRYKRKSDKQTARTFSCGLWVITNGQIRLFQCKTRVITPRVINAGLLIGSIILHQIWRYPAPSIVAASERSLGIDI